MRQQPAQFGRPIENGARDRLLAILGLTPAALGSGPVQIVSTGHSKLLVPLADRALLDGIVTDFAALAAFSAEIGCNGFYPFTTVDPDPGADAHGRMFAPAIGIPEDPVTGNANGPLGAYLLHHGLAEPDVGGRLDIRAIQGERMGRPGSVQVEAWRGPAGSIEVRIAGEAVIVFETELVL